jgi:hypothetical protein
VAFHKILPQRLPVILCCSDLSVLVTRVFDAPAQMHVRLAHNSHNVIHSPRVIHRLLNSDQLQDSLRMPLRLVVWAIRVLT